MVIVVGISKECIHGHMSAFICLKADCILGFQRNLACYLPFLGVPVFSHKGGEGMSLARPHVMVIVNHANEATEMLQ